MMKEKNSTFLPIVNIGIRTKPVKSKVANSKIKLVKVSVLFLQPIRYHEIDGLQSCMSITWDVWPLVPLLVRSQPPPQALRFSQGRGERLVMNRKGRSPSRLPLRAHFYRERDVGVQGRFDVSCLQLTPTVFSYSWIAFLKSSSILHSILNNGKKEVREEEKSSSAVGLFVILDNVSSSRSWSAEKWRLVHNRSRSVHTLRSFYQFISKDLKDFVPDDIQTINFLPSRLYYMILSRSRSPKRRHQDKTASSLYFSFGHGGMRARARGERWIREKRGMTSPFFALYWCSCVNISFIFTFIP